MNVQRDAEGIFESDACVRIIRHRLCLEAPGGRQIPLVLNYLKGSRGSKFQFALVCLKHLLLKSPRLSGGFVAGLRLLESNHRVLNIHAHLTGAALQVELILSELEHADRVICLRCAVAKRDLEAGEILDEYGMYTTYGEAVNAEEMSTRRYLPEGLVEGCRLRRDVKKDEVLGYDDVELPKGRLDALQSAYDLNGTRNMEVRFAWLDLAVGNRYDPAVPSLEQFLESQGRGKFVKPLIKALAKDSQWGRPIAMRIYAKARPLYHPLVTRELDELKLG